MTINKLIRELQKIEQKHGKRIKVMCAAKDMYIHFNEVYSHVHVREVSIECIDEGDGDGGIIRHDVTRVVLS